MCTVRACVSIIRSFFQGKPPPLQHNPLRRAVIAPFRGADHVKKTLWHGPGGGGSRHGHLRVAGGVPPAAHPAAACVCVCVCVG